MSRLPEITKNIKDEFNASDIKQGKDIIYYKVNFKERTLNENYMHIDGVTFYECLFTKETIKSVTFSKCRFIKCLFNGVKIIDCEFQRCFFSECSFFKAKISGTYIDPESFSFSSIWHKEWSNINASWYQELYKNSKNLHQEKFAMNADKRFQFYQRYNFLFGKNRSLKKIFGGLTYDIVLGYGYGILNTLTFTIAFVSLFAFLIEPHVDLGKDSRIVESLYFSIVSFSTVGYGEITPYRTTLALVITTSFLFLSVIWGAIVTAVIVKRLVK